LASVTITPLVHVLALELSVTDVRRSSTVSGPIVLLV